MLLCLEYVIFTWLPPDENLFGGVKLVFADECRNDGNVTNFPHFALLLRVYLMLMEVMTLRNRNIGRRVCQFYLVMNYSFVGTWFVER